MLWLSDARGVYIPRDFANSFNDWAKSISGVSEEDIAILRDGPEQEFYWETWDDVCNNAVITDENGNKYRIWQEGDCWLIPEDMDWDDETGFFKWPEDETITD
jgi:hypothetical protein